MSSRTPNRKAIPLAFATSAIIAAGLGGITLTPQQASADDIASPSISARADGTLPTASVVDGVLTIPTVDEYDAAIRSNGGGSIDLAHGSETELLVMQRTLVNRIGHDDLISFANKDDDHVKAVEWLMSDSDALRDYVTSGTPAHGSYEKSIDALSAVYNGSKTIGDITYNFVDDLENDTPSEYTGRNGTLDETIGDVMRRLMISISMTHDGEVNYWTAASGSERYVDSSNPVDRYWILRTFRMDDERYRFDSATFDSLTVPEMEIVTGQSISDSNLAWLNWYVRQHGNFSSGNLYCGYDYLRYTSDFSKNGGYSNSKYYLPENESAYDTKYEFETWNDDDPMMSEYDLHYGYVDGTKKEHAPWIVFEQGGVCGAMSKTGCNVSAAFGRPALVWSQPGHAAHGQLSVNAKGEGEWGIHCDISGWAQSGVTGSPDGVSRRNALLDWNKSGTGTGWRANYTLIAQDALNRGDYRGDDYSDTELLLMLVDAVDPSQREAVIEQAISTQKINMDAWHALIDEYESQDVDASKWRELAERVASSMRYYPMPCWNLIHDEILPHLDKGSDEWAAAYDAAAQAMDDAAVADDTQILQPSPCNALAKWIKGGQYGYVMPVSFSLIGSSKDSIVVADGWAEVDAEYSLDGGDTWVPFKGMTKLDADAMAQVNADDDVLVRFSGNHTWRIDVTQAAMPDLSTLWVNQRENFVTNISGTIEYSTDGGETWIATTKSTPRFADGQTVLLRGAQCATTFPSQPVSVTFDTEDVDWKHAYIALNRIVGTQCSSALSKQPKEQAVDGNGNTYWLTANVDHDKWLTLELDGVTKVSAVEYVPRQDKHTGGRVSGLSVYVSTDGVEWQKVAEQDGWAADASDEGKKPHMLEFEPVDAKYVRIQNEQEQYVNLSAAIVNVFEDVTEQHRQSVGVSVGALGDMTYGERVGDDDAATVTIASDGNAAAEIADVRLTGDDADAFELVGEASGSIESGESDTSVKVKPVDGLAAGEYEATIEVEYGGGQVASAGVRLVVAKAGQVLVVPDGYADGAVVAKTSIALPKLPASKGGIEASYRIVTSDSEQQVVGEWQSEPVFDGLDAGTAYEIEACYLGDANHEASAAVSIGSFETESDAAGEVGDGDGSGDNVDDDGESGGNQDAGDDGDGGNSEGASGEDGDNDKDDVTDGDIDDVVSSGDDAGDMSDANRGGASDDTAGVNTTSNVSVDDGDDASSDGRDIAQLGVDMRNILIAVGGIGVVAAIVAAVTKVLSKAGKKDGNDGDGGDNIAGR